MIGLPIIRSEESTVVLISRLRVVNYRMFHDVEIRPWISKESNLVVLIGYSGSGKTTMLRLLHNLLRPPTGRCVDLDDFRDDNKPVMVEIDLRGPFPKDRLLRKFRLRDDAGQLVLPFRFEFRVDANATTVADKFTVGECSDPIVTAYIRNRVTFSFHQVPGAEPPSYDPPLRRHRYRKA